MSVLDQNIGRRWRTMRSNPLTSFTAASLTRALNHFEAGYLRDAALLWETVEKKDDDLCIAAPKRRKAVSRRPWEILTLDDSPEAATQAEALKFFFNHITCTHALDRNLKGGLKTLIRQMMLAPFQRYAVHEIVWKPINGKLSADFTFVPLYFFENTTGSLRYTGPEMTPEGSELKEGEWLTTVAEDALLDAALTCFLFKRFSLQDWLNFSEKFGVPGIHGETQAAPGSEEWTKFTDALDAFANDWIIATSSGAKINLIEASASGDTPFGPMVERMGRRLVAMCRGADLGTMSAKDAVGASLQEGETDLLLEDDCELISETLNTQLSRRVLEYLFGTVEPLAYFQLQPPQQKDVKTEIEVDKFLLESGGALDGAATFERYGRAVPADAPQGFLLSKGSSPAPASQPAADLPTDPAANDTTPTLAEGSALLRNAVARAVGVVPQWLAPLADELTALEEKARDGISDAELQQFVEAAALRLPELFGQLDIGALASEIEAASGAAVINGVTAAFRSRAKQLVPQTAAA